jgi:uroporphyrinogen-III synthase
VRRPLVLNTRPREQAAELSRLLDVAGFQPVEAPAIAIVPAWDGAELERVRRDLRNGAFDWVVLPSQNSARCLEAELRAAHIVSGVATAQALGIAVDIALDKFSAAAALDTLRSRLAPGATVLVPRAAEGRDELLDGLGRLGANVTAPIAYHTVPVAEGADRLRAGDVDVVTVCSPSALRSVAPALEVRPTSRVSLQVAVGRTSFDRLRRRTRQAVQNQIRGFSAAFLGTDPRLVCLGETTAETARRMNLRVDAVAQHTSMQSLVDAVLSLAAEARA